MLLTYLGLFLVLLYTAIMCCKMKCIPPSVSETYYHGGGSWFTLTLIVASFLITIGLITLSEGTNWEFLAFLTSAGMAFVGAAPHFHDYEKTVHFGGASMLMAGSQLWLWIFTTPWMALCWLPIFFWIKKNSAMFWCEMTCIFSVAIGLLFY